jgi:hypothetical protein
MHHFAVPRTLGNWCTACTISAEFGTIINGLLFTFPHLGDRQEVGVGSALAVAFADNDEKPEALEQLHRIDCLSAATEGASGNRAVARVARAGFAVLMVCQDDQHELCLRRQLGVISDRPPRAEPRRSRRTPGMFAQA